MARELLGTITLKVYATGVDDLDVEHDTKPSVSLNAMQGAMSGAEKLKLVGLRSQLCQAAALFFRTWREPEAEFDISKRA